MSIYNTISLSFSEQTQKTLNALQRIALASRCLLQIQEYKLIYLKCYFEMISETYNIDCIEYMRGIEDKFFDLAIVDPPYGINRNGMNMGNSIFNKDDKKWDNSIPTQDYFNELFRVSKNQIVWGGNYFPLPQSQYFCIWDKGETMYGRDFAECEYAWVNYGRTRIFKKNPNQPERIHPTQKPVALYKWLLTNYAKQGDKILDTHLGSQSSRIAAYDLGFDFWGCELDKDYFEQGNKRFEQFKAQGKLF